MEQEAEDLNEEVTQWVTFALDEEVYGINVMQVQEVLGVGDRPGPGGPALRPGHHQPAGERGPGDRHPPSVRAAAPGDG